MKVTTVNGTCVCSVKNFADKFMETSFNKEMDLRQTKVTPRTTGDSPIHQARRKNVPLNLPDWQPVLATEPAEDSPVIEIAPSELPWPPVATEYSDQQPVTELPVHAECKSDILSQSVNWEQLDKPVQAATPAKQTLEGYMYEAPKSEIAPSKTGDSPVRQVRKRNIPLNLPDWQPKSVTEPAEDSPVEEVAPTETLPPVANEYTDQQPVTELPVHAEHKSDVSSQPVDWDQLGKPVPTALTAASFPSVTKQIIEGEMYETEDKSETNDVADDGSDSQIRRRVMTRRTLLPVTELMLENGEEVSRTTSDVVVAIHIDEFVDIMPCDVDDPHIKGLETTTSVRESQEPLETGGTLTRRVTTKTLRKISWQAGIDGKKHP